MKTRCFNQNSLDYKRYGARGITVSKEWLDFENFKQDMFSSYKKGLTLDRINNNKGYFKENCRWVGRNEQANNTRNIARAVKYNFDNQKLDIRQWAEKLGVKRNLIYKRLYRGWSVEKTFGGLV